MNLESLGRKELQALAKQYGIKANLSTAAIVEQLTQVLAKDFEEQQDNFLNEEEIQVEKAIEERKSILGKRKSEIPVEDQPPQIQLPELSDEVGPFSVSPHETEISLKPMIDSPMINPVVQDEWTPLEDAQVGDAVEVLHEGLWQVGTVKRVNKISYRVKLELNNKEVTVKMSETRLVMPQDKTVSHDVRESPLPIEVPAQPESPTATECCATATAPNTENRVEQSCHIDSTKSMDGNSDYGADENFVDASEMDIMVTEEILRETDPIDENEEEFAEESFVDAIEGDEKTFNGEEDTDQGNEESANNENGDQSFDNDEIAEPEDGVVEEGDVSMTMDIADDDDLLFTTVCVPTPSVVKKPFERKSFAAIDRKTPKKARVTELLPWNSCTKQQSESRFSLVPSSEKKAPQSARKSFSTAPAVPAPHIVPKTNAAQRLRMEAMKKKNEGNNNNQKSLGTKITPLANKITPLTQKVSSLTAKVDTGKQSEKIKFVAKEKLKVSADAQKPAISTENIQTTGNKLSTASVNKKITPNFSKMHQKQFNNSKPITSLVERNHDIAKKMDEAFEAASNGVPKDSMKNKVLAVNKSVNQSKPFHKTKNLETKKTSFLSDSNSNNNKENGSFISSFLSSTGKITTASTRVSVKEASINQAVSNKEARRDTFMQESKKKRDDLISTKRRSVAMEPTPHNPFHYVA